MKRLVTVLLSLAICAGMISACGNGSSQTESSGNTSTAEAPGGEAKAYKVAAIFGGSINDGNWNETQYNGLKRIEALGAVINAPENVGDADSAEMARTYAAEGYDLIYLTTNSYQDYCKPIADDFPEVMFVQINGTEISDNFISVRIADEAQGFMQGVVAALLTETGKVGFIGGLEINPIKLGSSGFRQGVAYVNEKYGLNVEPMCINTGSFTDVNAAKEQAISFIESGADVVTPMANDASVGVMEAAEDKGVMAIGCGLGQDASAPSATQIIVVKDVAIAYDVTYEAFTKGELAADQVELFGANKGVVYLTDWMVDVDQDIKDKVEAVMAGLVSGDIVVSTD